MIGLMTNVYCDCDLKIIGEQETLGDGAGI